MIKRFSRWVLRVLVKGVLKVRWAYFHLSPTYVKVVRDTKGKEVHFYNRKTNTLHCQYTVSE